MKTLSLLVNSTPDPFLAWWYLDYMVVADSIRLIFLPLHLSRKRSTSAYPRPKAAHTREAEKPLAQRFAELQISMQRSININKCNPQAHQNRALLQSVFCKPGAPFLQAFSAKGFDYRRKELELPCTYVFRRFKSTSKSAIPWQPAYPLGNPRANADLTRSKTKRRGEIDEQSWTTMPRRLNCKRLMFADHFGTFCRIDQEAWYLGGRWTVIVKIRTRRVLVVLVWILV